MDILGCVDDCGDLALLLDVLECVELSAQDSALTSDSRRWSWAQQQREEAEHSGGVASRYGAPREIYSVTRGSSVQVGPIGHEAAVAVEQRRAPGTGSGSATFCFGQWARRVNGQPTVFRKVFCTTRLLFGTRSRALVMPEKHHPSNTLGLASF